MVIYPTEWQAEQVALQYDEIVVPVDGGWTTMTPRDYFVWSHQV